MSIPVVSDPGPSGAVGPRGSHGPTGRKGGPGHNGPTGTDPHEQTMSSDSIRHVKLLWLYLDFLIPQNPFTSENYRSLT